METPTDLETKIQAINYNLTYNFAYNLLGTFKVITLEYLFFSSLKILLYAAGVPGVILFLIYLLFLGSEFFKLRKSHSKKS